MKYFSNLVRKVGISAKIIVLALVVAAAVVIGVKYLKPHEKAPIKAGGYPPGSESEDELLGLLSQQGAIGKAASGLSAKDQYRESLSQIKNRFDENPQGMLALFEDILDREPGELDLEKYLVIHNLTKLPLTQTVDLLKKEVERDLPPPDIEDESATEANIEFIEAIARKIAAIEAIVKQDPEYTLDVISDPDTPAAVKRAAVESYVLTDDDKITAMAQMQELLTADEFYMLSPLTTNPPPKVIKNYFLGPPEVEKTTTKLKPK